LKAKQEAELKAKQEAELKAKQEAELKAKQEAELKAKQETELKAKQETELKAKQETELKAKQETELKAKQEAVRKNCVLKSENYHFQKLFCDKNEKNCNELIAYLIESDVHGVLGKLSDFIRWDEIEEKYFQTIRIIKNFIPYRIVVENKEILIRIEDLADIPKFHPIGICSLDSYELINQDLPKLEGIINWAYNLIPLSSQKILPLLQFYLSDLIVVDSKKARDQLRNSSKYNVVSLTGEFLSKTGDIIVGKKNWVDLNEF
jgi:chromosome segregation ATPase